MGAKLAIEGGPRAKTTPNFPMFPGGLEVGEEEKRLVIEVLDSKYLFRYYGPGMGIEEHVSKVETFEQEFREIIGAGYALGVNSCTSALITSLVACGVGPGSEVIIPAYTFFATCAAVLVVGAIPVICDVDESLTIDPRELEKSITPYTKAVIPVHMRGVPCDMDRIMELARKHNLKVVEDVAQAAGGSYHGKRLGSFGDCNAFSLQYHKIITSGEGGVVTTDDENLYGRALWTHDTAACWRPRRFAPAAKSGEIFAGYNFRMGELQGAVALAQIRRLDELLERMRRNKRRIMDGIKGLKGLEFRKLHDPEGDTAICLSIYLPNAKTARRFSEAIKAEGIEGGSVYDAGIPDWHIYAHWDHIIAKASAFADGFPFTYHEKLTGKQLRYSKDMCPKCLQYLGRSVMIDIPPQMTEDDCDMVAEGIRKVGEAYL